MNKLLAEIERLKKGCGRDFMRRNNMFVCGGKNKVLCSECQSSVDQFNKDIALFKLLLDDFEMKRCSDMNELHYDFPETLENRKNELRCIIRDVKEKLDEAIGGTKA